MKGGKEETFRLINGLKLDLISNNLGDAKTLVTHPATTTHFKLDDDAKAELGIGPNSVRVSIGLEDSDDLVHDFDQALSHLA